MKIYLILILKNFSVSIKILPIKTIRNKKNWHKIPKIKLMLKKRKRKKKPKKEKRLNKNTWVIITSSNKIL